ncbi:MAG: exonuclease domain-containing protein [Candidatus Altimarinota bacterium]
MNFSSYVCLDLETTGLEPQICDVIEIAMIKVRDGKIVERMETFVYTPLEISEHVSYLTGITAKDIEKAPDFIQLIPQIEAFIGEDPLVGHNIWFDWNFLIQKGVKIQKNQLWDTYTMSNILYPELPSHSLETNTKYFGIGHEDSHRAMADVIASHELWQILLNTFPALSPDQRQQLQKLKQISSWPLLDFFMQERPAQKLDLDLQATSTFAISHLEPLEVSDRSEPLFIHAQGYDPVNTALRLQTNKKTLYLAGYEHTLQKLHQAFPNAVQLLSPYSYLSDEKIQQLWQKEALTDGESSLLLKTILHPHAKTKEEFVLTHPERGIWREVNIAEQEIETGENNYTKAYQQSLASQQVIASQFHVLSDLEYLKHFDQVVLLEPHLFEDNATGKFGKALYLDQWLQQSSDEAWTKAGEFLFAQANQLGSKLVPASQYPEHVILTDMITSSNEFIRLRSSIQQLSELPTPNPELISYLKYYQVFFHSNDPSWVRWFTVDPRRGVSLNVAPLSVRTLLKKHFFDQSTVITISDTASQFSCFPDMERWEFSKEHPFKVELPPLESIKGTKKEGDHPALISYLAQELQKMKGKTGVIFSSKSVLKRYFFDLVKVLPEEMLLLGEDISGGTGKLQDRYTSGNQDHKVLFLTYRNLRVFPAEVMDFDHIILQSLPFDPPGYPVNQARADQYENAFMDFVVPKTQQNLLEIVTNFTKREGDKILSVLDRRVQEQKYAEEMLRIFSNEPT